MNKCINILNISLLTIAFLSSSQAVEQKIPKNKAKTSQTLNSNERTLLDISILPGIIEPDTTTYETGHPYENNTDDTRDLSIPGASALTVTITGEVELNYDKIFITDSTGNETEYTGVLNEEFTVPGDHITIRFTSDGSVVKEGAVVHIAEDIHPDDNTTYETGNPYGNNIDDTKELFIDGAESLRVTITGEIEQGYDKIFIIDDTGNETEYTGVLDENFTVEGNHITVRFTSDGSVVKEGAVVHITEGIHPDHNTTYETGHPYADNTYETQELSILGASELTVTITGEVEQDYDRILITDANGNKTQYTGVLNETFTVPSDHITVIFISDGSIVKEGAVVHITEGIHPDDNTTYETGHPYENNTDETQELSIPGAESLSVIITGSVEQNYDKIFITDANGNETEYTGVLDENFTVEGDHITVRFTSDGSVVKEGAVVHIEDVVAPEVTVESISIANNVEGTYNEHHVVLSATTTRPVDLNLSFENITTSDDDYDKIPEFNPLPEGNITVNNAGTIVTIPEGVKEFDIVIELYLDELYEPVDELYELHLGNQSTIGLILDNAS